MSFILDALRKSETDRQRDAAPSLADTRYRRPGRRRSVWVPVLIVVLLANAVLLAVLLNRSPEEGIESPNTPMIATPGRATRTLAVPPPENDVHPLATEVRTVAAQPKPAVANPQSGQSPSRPSGTAPASDAAPTTQAAVLPPATEAPARAEALPSLEQLSIAGLISLPPLHVDIHVFSAEPTERFVFINMSKYREGDQLKEGPEVAEITDTGVVLRHQGNQFLLDRE